MIRAQKSLVCSIYKIEKGFKNDNKLKEELIEKMKKQKLIHLMSILLESTQKRINEQFLKKILIFEIKLAFSLDSISKYNVDSKTEFDKIFRK